MRPIDADALKEAVSKHPLIDFTDDDIFELIDNAPTVFDDKAYSDGYAQGTCDCEHAHERPQGEWIPVSERLPEINKEVIVTDIEISNTYQSRYVGSGYWECDNGTLKNRIIAWMPLPEPYKKGGAE